MSEPLVIIGAGLAGYALLRALRQGDGQRAVTLVTSDDGSAYAKSALPHALAEGRPARELVLATAEQIAHRYDATILTHRRVLRIDRPAHELVSQEGRTAYAQLVVATGSSAVRRRPRGTAGERLLTLGNLADYAYLRSELAGRRRIAVLGGSTVGCEVADSLARRGYAVTLFEPGPHLLADVLPGLSGERVAHALRAAGVRVVTEDGVQRIDHDVDGLALRTLTGTTVSADLVICARGRRPRAELAADAGLAVARGILVDRRLGTADPDIFALGECAELEGRLFVLHDDIEAGARVLADVLSGGYSKLRWQPRLRRLRLESCPAVVCEPPPIAGEWQETANARGVTALFRDRGGSLRGFALLGERVADGERLLAQVIR